MNPRVLLIDNYDSFTYNLVQAFLVLGADVLVHRNDAIDVAAAVALEPSHLVISPGPGRPSDAGVSIAMIAEFAERVPVFGVCLGHQCIVEHFGGNVIGAATLRHGKSSEIRHDGKMLYRDLPNPFVAGRYHSLAADRQSIGGSLDVTATTADGEIMGVRHKHLNVEGVQFHPESVLTPDGPRLMGNFLYADSARAAEDR
jgi:anthranilate synthase/aminodeoxychorismate synthase-like glutamine amidotransferase